MSIERADISDLEKIFAIYQMCKMKLDAEGIKQWYEQYPNPAVLQEDIYSSELFKYVFDNKIVAAIVLTEKQEKEYETVGWQEVKRKILVVKRLAVDPGFQGRGIAGELMMFAEDYAVKNRYASIRLDAYSGNKVVLNFYKNLGYQEAGEVLFPGRDLPFKCFEKKL